MKIIFSLVIVLFCCTSAISAPSVSGVSGTINNGNSITISGSSFGSNSTPSPLVFDRFELGSNGNYVRDGVPTIENMPDPYTCNDSSTCNGAWTWHDYPRGSEAARPKYTNSGQRTGSILSMIVSHSSSTYDNQSLEVIHPMANTGDAVFFSFWWKMDKTSTLYSRNIKPWQQYGSDGNEPMAYIGFGSPDAADGGVRSSVQDGGTNIDSVMWGTTDLADIENQWVRVDVRLKQSGVNTANGEFTYSIIRTNANIAVESNTAIKTRTTSKTWKQFLFGEYFACDDPSSATGDIYIDDFYISTTQARVEICAESTWGGRRNCEIQPATSWGASSITTSVNQGALANSSTAYVYVVDVDGVVNSSGYEIVIGSGGGGDTTAPTTTISTSDPSSISSNSLTVTGTASDAVGVSGCKWRIGSAPDGSNGTSCTGTTSPSCSTSGYSSGSNTLYVGCYDAAGNYGSDSIVVNYTPSVSATILTGSTTGTLR